MDRACLRSVLLSLVAGWALYGQTPTILGVFNVSGSGPNVAPGGIAYIFGSNLSTDTASAPNTSVVVTVGGIKAYVSYESPAQLIVQIPVDAPVNMSIPLIVGSSAPFPITLSEYAPVLFGNLGLSNSGTIVAAINANGSIVSSSAPALPGEAIAIYATGLGPTSPPVATGVAPTGNPQTTTLPVVTIAGLQGTVLFSGLVDIGVYEVTCVVPASAPPGNQSISITIGGVTSSALTLPIGSVLGTNTLLVGSAAGSSSVVLSYYGAWTATSNSSFLHIPAGSSSGTGSGLVVFTYDAFTGTGTRTGTLTIAGLTVTVTQAGTNYIGPGPVTTLVSSGLSGPDGVAVDGSGNVYIADDGNNAIKKWSASTQQVTTLVSSGLNIPVGVAVDGLGNVYIADYYNNAIKEWSASTQQVTTLVSSGLNYPEGVAVDGSGNVYFSDNNAIKEWSTSTQQMTTLVSGMSFPVGVAVDGAGNVYIADTNNSAIKEWSASTQQVTTLVSSGLNLPLLVAVDGSGNVYIAGAGNGAIYKWSASTQQVTTLVSSGLNYPEGVAVDGSGNVYFSDTLNFAIKEIPYAFVGPASLTEPPTAGSDSLLPVLPVTASLTGIFAPTSDQSWLTIGTIASGVINFSFAGNTTDSARTAHITVLGHQLTVTQNGLTAQTITFGTLSNRPFGTAPFTISATATSGLTVSFASTTPAVCTVSGTTVTLVATGTCTIQATQAGNANYAAATPVSQSFQVTQGSQTIAFGALANQLFGALPFTVSAIATSGLTVSFASTTPTCSVSGTTVTLTGVGTCTIQATQAGNTNYAAATPVSQSFQVTQASQTINFGALANQPYGTVPFAVSATATSGLAVSFASTTTSVCTISGATVTLMATGTCTIQATQAGNTNYAAAAPVNRSFQVPQGSQTISFGMSQPFAYATNNSNVSVISTATNTVVATVTAGNSPFGVAITPDGTRAYVTNSGDNTVSAINTATSTVVATVPGVSNPWGVAITPDGTRAYVTSQNSSNVSVIDTGTNTVVATVPTAGVTRGVAITPDGTRAYVVNNLAGFVSVIDTGTNAVVATIPVGGGIQDVAITPDGSRAYVANFGAGDPGNVVVINTAINAVEATITAGTNPYRVAISPDGTGAYVTNYSSGNVSVINTATDTVVATVTVGNLPFGVAITPDGSRAYVANSGENIVSVINTAASNVVATVAVGTGGVFGVAITPSFGTLSNQAFGAAPFTVSATATSGLTVSFSSLTTPVCTVSGSTVTLVSGGTCTIQATQAGNANYAAAAPVSRSFQVMQASQTVTFGPLPKKLFGTAPFTVSATTSSGLTVSFNSTTPAVCTVSGATVTLVAAGTCTIQATQAGNTDYAAATPVNQSFQVIPVLTITTTLLPAGQAGVAYSQALAATGGTGAYTWSVISGRLPAGLSLNSSTGVISGTPAVVTSSIVTFQVTDSGTPPQTAAVVLAVTVQAQGSVSITTTSLANGQVGAAYSQTLTAAGGQTPYSWSLALGTLPRGLSLGSSTGVISGTPTVSVSNLSLTFRVTDSSTPSQTATATLTLTIGGTAALSISTTSLSNAQVGAAYTQTVSATGGTGPYSWSATGLPANLSINPSTGVITGTPTAAAAGTTTVSITVTDSSNPQQTATKNFSLTVQSSGSPLTITTTSLPAGQAGVAYSQALAATGGTGAYTWSVISGRLPAGLSLNTSTGVISGTPAVVTSSIVTFQVTDLGTPPQTATVVLAVTVQAQGPVSITTTALPNGQVGAAYSQTLTATGGQTPYSWSLASGTLPRGLSLGASTGVISGTPTVSVSNLSLTFRVTDSSTPSQTATATLTLTIGGTAALSISTTSLSNAQVAVAYTQTVSATGGTGPYSWSALGLPANLSINPSTGAITGTPTAAAAGTTTVSITVKDSSNPQQTATKNFSLTVQSSGSPLTITTTLLPAGQAGVAYSQALAATGGTGAYTWSVISGRLPAGLSLNTSTGVISGTPAVVTSSIVTFQVTDSGTPQQTATLSLTLTVN